MTSMPTSNEGVTVGLTDVDTMDKQTLPPFTLSAITSSAPVTSTVSVVTTSNVPMSAFSITTSSQYITRATSSMTSLPDRSVPSIPGLLQNTPYTMGTSMYSQYQMSCPTYPALYSRMTQMTPVIGGLQPGNTVLNSINQAVARIEKDMQRFTQETTSVKNQLDGVLFEQELDHKLVIQQNRKIHALEDRLDLACKLIINQDTEIKALKNKSMYEDLKQKKSSIVIHGLLPKDGQSEMELVKDFITTILKIPVDLKILKAYRMGKTDNSPVVVQFATKTAKNTIFEHTKNLKGVKNSVNKAYSIRSHLPEKMVEEDMRKRQIVAANKKLPQHHQANITLKKGILKIGSSVYSKKVETSDAKAMLSIPSDDMVELEKVPLVSTGQQISDQGSVFHGYTARVENIEQVRRIYKHFKLKFAEASHVMMAYALPGLNKAYDEDYVDDGEHGGGRRLLRVLLDANLNNQILLVVRYFGHVYLGVDRFKHITTVAENAIQASKDGITFTSSLNLHQSLPLVPQQQQRVARRSRFHSRRRATPEAIRGARRGINRFSSSQPHFHTDFYSLPCSSENTEVDDSESQPAPGARTHADWADEEEEDAMGWTSQEGHNSHTDAEVDS